MEHLKSNLANSPDSANLAEKKLVQKSLLDLIEEVPREMTYSWHLAPQIRVFKPLKPFNFCASLIDCIESNKIYFFEAFEVDCIWNSRNTVSPTRLRKRFFLEWVAKN